MLFSVDKNRKKEKVVWQLLQSCFSEKAVKVYLARGLPRRRAKEREEERKRKERRHTKLKFSKVPTFLEGWLLLFPYRDIST